MNQTTPKVKHPRGLMVLFFTEMWERFGYYLMIGILLLYLRDTVEKGGRGMDNGMSTDIVGTYAALVYLTPFIGGLIADRILGYIKAIFLGGSLMAAGYFLLSMNGSPVIFFSGLACVIVGNGFFKPNISTLLGNIYNKEELKPKKDVAYNIFYMGVNIGAFACNFVAAYLRLNYSWGWAFAAAGIGMVIGLIWLSTGLKHVRHADIKKQPAKEDMSLSSIFSTVFIPIIIFGAIGWFLPEKVFGHYLLGKASNDAFIFACFPIVYFFIRLWKRATPAEKPRMSTLLILFGVAIIFWNIYNQNATALTIWADNYTDRKAPEGVQSLLKPFDMLQVVNTQTKEVPVLDEHLRIVTGPDKKALTEQGVDPYFKNLQPERVPPDGQDLKLLSAELFQSANPFWIIVLTPLIVAFFNFMTSRRKELSIPTKIAWGLIISGLSSVVMVVACYSTDIYHNKVGMSWLIGSYGVFTISELLLSPVGLSLVSKVAPRRLTALMMGGWFLTTSIGAKISGIFASYWDDFDDKATFFWIGAIAAVIAGFAIMPLTKKLGKIVADANASSD